MHLQTDICSPHKLLCDLAAKYAVTLPSEWRLEFSTNGKPDVFFWGIREKDDFVPVFPWRNERRFIELKRIVETKTLEDVVLCRFSCVIDETSSNLRQILYREFDLLEWIIGSDIVSVFGSAYENKFVNLIAKLENGTIVSIEAGTTLPEGSEMLDRHELIARRGVASDRVVDTHVPQQSVYLFEKSGVRSWTDTDAELFGLETDEINAVRAAFDLAKTPEKMGANRAQHKRLLEFVDQSLQS